MKAIFLFSIFIILALSSVSVSAIYGNMVVDSGGQRFGSYENGFFVFPKVPTPLLSGVSNAKRGNTPQGFNPYYLTNTPSSNKEAGVTHIRRHTALAEAVYDNPDILKPRYSTNFHRAVKALDNPVGNIRGLPVTGISKSFKEDNGINTGNTARGRGKGYFDLFHAQGAVTGRIKSHTNKNFDVKAKKFLFFDKY